MLIELAEVSRARQRSAASAKASFASRWQSSKVPSTATAVTLPPSVVNCASCTRRHLAFGKQHDDARARRRRKPAPRRCRCRRRSRPAPSAAARRVEVRHQPRHDARPDVLEGEGRSVEELERGHALVDRPKRNRKVQRVGEESSRARLVASSSPTKVRRRSPSRRRQRCAAQARSAGDGCVRARRGRRRARDPRRAPS